MSLQTFIIILSANALIFIICYKFKLLTEQKTKKHKNFVNQVMPSYQVGGVFLLNLLIINYYNINYYAILPIVLIFILGLGSDLRYLESPKIRFFFQIFIILLFVEVLNIKILDVRIEIFNEILQVKLISTVFTIFCIMIFINGINFIDGINVLTILYLLIVYIFILILNYNELIALNDESIFYLICLLLIVLVLNYFGLVFLGDSGSYLLGLVTSGYLISSVNTQSLISPYLVILIVIYPCFEILFSIIRRSKIKKKYYRPDNFHLHHLIYNTLKNTFQLKILNLHLITALLINSVVLIFFIFGLFFYSQTKVLLFLIIFKIIIYLFAYKLLKKI